MNAQLKFWLETTFQNGIEVSLQLSKKPAPQQKPFDNKYKAIEKLKKLIEYKDHSFNFISHSILGQLYSDVEQTHDSVKSYTKALLELSKLSSKEIPKFYQYFIVCYNMLGLSFINRQDLDGGIGCLCKAYEVYQACKQWPGVNTYHNRSYQSNGRQFNFYYQGGNDFEQVEESHTLTLFYLAQSYTKIDLKHKAAEYCGLTLKREWAYQKFEVKEFCHNLIGLSEYYFGNKFFAQAEYILLLALKVLPEGRKKKMRALVNIEIGKLILEILQHSCQKIRNNEPITNQDNEQINKKFLLFEDFDQKFPEIGLASDMEGCKSLFRKANTQFKKALQIFVLDGYVTEHIEILSEQSKLYKCLSLIEKSRQRVFSMLQKRRELLEYLLKQLNSKAYPATWQKILVEVSQIYNDIFTIKSLLVLDTKTGPAEAKLQEMNKIGFQSIFYYKEIIKALEEDKDTEKHEQYYRSLINAKFNIAKTLSKMISLDKAQRVQFLKQSYENYSALAKFIQSVSNLDIKLRNAYVKELQLTNEMIAMMPNKIDRINYGMVSPLE